MKQERIEKLKDITVSVSQARRIAVQTDELTDEEFEKFVAKKEKK